MNRFRFVMYSIVMTLCFCGCEVMRPDYLPEWQSGLFSLDENTHIEELIDIDGYYIAVDYSDSTRNLPFLLYNDGTFGTFDFRKTIDAKNKIRWMDMYDTSIVDSNNPYNYIYCMGGHYVVNKDTIIVDKYYDTASLLRGLCKLKFVIMDRQHLHFVQIQYFSVKHNGIITKNIDELYEFIPVKRKLPSTGVSIKFMEKSVWKDEKEWKIWKRKCWRNSQQYSKEKRKEYLLEKAAGKIFNGEEMI